MSVSDLSLKLGMVSHVTPILADAQFLTGNLTQEYLQCSLIFTVFISVRSSLTKLHHILHPNMPRHTRYTVESVNLSDGLPCHRVTTRDVVDRAPFSVYGTFHGIIGIAKSTCAPDLNRIDVNEIWRGENPVMAIRVNQMDNGLLAATDFQREAVKHPSPSEFIKHSPEISTVVHVFPIADCLVGENGCNGLNSLRWNPYMPYELLLHFRDSPRILRCNAQDLSFDIFRRRVLDSFTPEDLFTMEQVWDAGLPPDVVSERRKTYAAVDDVYPLLSYGEMYDKCKENPEISMPLCWTTPVPERSCHDEELVVHFVDTDLGTATPTSMMLRRSYSDSNLHRKFPGFNLHVAPPSLVRVKGLFEEASSPPTKVPFEELESSLTKNLLSTNDNVLEENGLINRAGSIAKMLRKSSSSSILETLMDGNSVDSDQMSTAESNSTLPITRRSISYTENVHVATENDDPSEEVGIEGTFERICSSHAENLSSIFNQLGLDFKDQKAMAELRDEIEAAMRYDSKQGFPLSYVVRNFDVHDSVTRSNVDDGHRIKLQHKVFSFDFAPVGYSGILCLENMENGSMKLVFVPFMAADEGFSVRPEYVKVLREIRMWEAFDSIPYHLYQTMKLRLCNGMDRIGDEKTLIQTAETSDLEDGATDGDEQSSIEKTPVSSDVCNIRPNIIAKGIPGILQLCTLEEDRDVVWQSCDSIHFTFLKIARSPIRKMILSPYCLPVTEDRVVSDERFAACTDILKQIPVIFLCFISGDTVRFIESIGGSDDNLKSDIDDESVKEQSSVNAPSLFTVFPTSYLDAAGVMPDLLHLAKAEFCRYSFILQRLERYCFRRKLLNLVPQIYWPDFKTSVDISCTFCGSSYEVALRNAEQAASEQLSQVRSRPTVTRTAASRSSVSVGSTMTSMSLSLTSTAPSDSDINVNTVTSSAMTPTSESYYDYNGVDGGTEAEVCFLFVWYLSGLCSFSISKGKTFHFTITLIFS
ncbi:unnamed protein product [Heligmosomoides polygyrus]|uniref:DUF676 domain-containing protein n=1 Tax=Heligmosomoides polygyrus TaxID=6339 RepID=A0A183FT20_HELPZ|nr:unnamed protein product [Heligmosomoides polygyrus]